MQSGEHRVETSSFHGRVRVMTAGYLIAESTEAVELTETGYPTVYYIPKSHIRMEIFEPSGTVTICPHKGEATYWTIRTAAAEIVDAAWSYEDPIEQVSAIRGYLAFDPAKIDAIESTTAGPAQQS